MVYHGKHGISLLLFEWYLLQNSVSKTMVVLNSTYLLSRHYMCMFAHLFQLILFIMLILMFLV